MHVDDVRMRSRAITILKPVSHCRKSVTLFFRDFGEGEEEGQF